MDFRYVVFFFHNTCSAEKPRYEVCDMTKGYPKCGEIIGGSNDEQWAHVLGRAAVTLNSRPLVDPEVTSKAIEKTIMRGDYE